MKHIIDTAIVLRRVNYGEKDRVLTLLTKHNGKISAFAKGIRAPKSRLAGGLELLSISEIGWVAGKSDLKTITSARLITHHENIVRDITSTNRAFEGLDCVLKLSDDDAGVEYYPILESYLVALSDKEYDKTLSEVWFRLRLMQAGGVLADINVVDDGMGQASGYRFNYDKQFFENDQRGQFSRNDIKLLKLLGKRAKPVRLEKPIGTEENLLQFTKTLYSFNVH